MVVMVVIPRFKGLGLGVAFNRAFCMVDAVPREEKGEPYQSTSIGSIEAEQSYRGFCICCCGRCVCSDGCLRSCSSGRSQRRPD
jgi:hypothetical protein